jgi:RNA 3'-terminal phosphate cyclase (ATP)
MIVIDGSAGEGGGQILRSALTLSLVTGKAFRIENIRANRPKPGLLRQHLACVRAAREISGAQVEGEALGASALTFHPVPARAGAYSFAVGTAGSTGLVLQTVLLPLALAGAPSRLELRGGTHNPYAPPFEMLAESWLPLLRRIGFNVTLTLHRHGFYPAGGGHVEAHISPAGDLAPLVLEEPGALLGTTAEILSANLHPNVATREAEVLRTRLGWGEEQVSARTNVPSDGPGNAVLLRCAYAHATGIIAGFGDPGTSADAVASRVAAGAKSFLAASVPVEAHLADQLLLPMALARGGCFVTTAPTPHTLSNIGVVEAFLGTAPSLERQGSTQWRVHFPA